ncbi:MAG: hypothetical protein ACM3KR_00960 [Deltaproteobacteria bacterium]
MGLKEFAKEIVKEELGFSELLKKLREEMSRLGEIFKRENFEDSTEYSAVITLTEAFICFSEDDAEVLSDLIFSEEEFAEIYDQACIEHLCGACMKI